MRSEGGCLLFMSVISPPCLKAKLVEQVKMRRDKMRHIGSLCKSINLVRKVSEKPVNRLGIITTIIQESVCMSGLVSFPCLVFFGVAFSHHFLRQQLWLHSLKGKLTVSTYFSLSPSLSEQTAGRLCHSCHFEIRKSDTVCGTLTRDLFTHRFQMGL